MDGNRKLVLDRFLSHLSQNYESWCDKHSFDKSDDHLVTFLIDQDLIQPTHIQRYTVCKEFDQLSEKPSFKKTQTVNTLADRFNLSERTVWSILKHGGEAKRNQR